MACEGLWDGTQDQRFPSSAFSGSKALFLKELPKKILEPSIVTHPRDLLPPPPLQNNSTFESKFHIASLLFRNLLETMTTDKDMSHKENCHRDIKHFFIFLQYKKYFFSHLFSPLIVIIASPGDFSIAA
jgi:hypothetical protein